MKSALLVFGLFIFTGASFAQSNTQQTAQTVISISELQANEFASYFELDNIAKEKAFQINELCRNKIEGLQSTTMEQSVIDEGIAYNRDLRLKSLKDLLTPKQQEWFYEFVMNSQYNQ